MRVRPWWTTPTSSSPASRRRRKSWPPSPACGCRQITERACQDAGFEPRIAFEADETLAAQALVAAGVGAALLPRLALTTVHPGVVARSLRRDAPTRRIWAARLPSTYHSP